MVTFAQWCQGREISGNWQEALYHRLMARYGAGVEDTTEVQWSEEWNLLLDEAVYLITGKTAAVAHLDLLGVQVWPSGQENP